MITDIVPLALPPVCGANMMLRLTLCCGARFIGKVGAVTLKPLPATFACKIVRLDLALLVTVNGRVCVLPTGTLPKFSPEVESDICALATPAKRRNARRTKFHQADLHWKMRRLIGRALFPRAHRARWGMMELRPPLLRTSPSDGRVTQHRARLSHSQLVAGGRTDH